MMDANAYWINRALLNNYLIMSLLKNCHAFNFIWEFFLSVLSNSISNQPNEYYIITRGSERQYGRSATHSTLHGNRHLSFTNPTSVSRVVSFLFFLLCCGLILPLGNLVPHFRQVFSPVFSVFRHSITYLLNVRFLSDIFVANFIQYHAAFNC